MRVIDLFCLMVDPIIFIIIAILGGGLGVKVTSTQNPVYSGLYLVLLFFLGSAISFLLGLEFMALLFLLVYAGAIAVLVLFVVMMLDVKAIENPWPARKKRLLYTGALFFVCVLAVVGSTESSLLLLRLLATTYMGLLVSFRLASYEQEIKDIFQDVITGEATTSLCKKVEEKNAILGNNGPDPSRREITKTLEESLNERVDMWSNLCDLEGLTDFFRLIFHQETVEGSYGVNTMWFLEFDSSCALNDPSYLLYSTHAILLIIAGIILLIAMVGAISLTLKKNCPESLYRQLGRESKNAVFAIREKVSLKSPRERHLEVPPYL